MKITMTSTLSGKENTLDLDITEEQVRRILDRYDTGEKVQDIVPHLDAPSREFLITGITPEEWAETFGNP